jgi:hypothetical protein
MEADNEDGETVTLGLMASTQYDYQSKAGKEMAC